MESSSPSTNTPFAKAETTEGAASEHARHALEEARAGTQEAAARSSELARNVVARGREALTDSTDEAMRKVQAQPLKSLLVAAAAGAAIAFVAGAFRSRYHERHSHR